MATKGKKKAKTTLIKRVGNKDHKVDLSHYAKAVSASGNASLDNGDETAKKLRGAELDDVYGTASKVLGESVKVLKARYKHLNPGMQRMNLGNRIRGAQA